jgi:hypothetical protein
MNQQTNNKQTNNQTNKHKPINKLTSQTKQIGIIQANVYAILEGTDATLPPVILADHFDTAFAEDIYDKTGKRVSNPGNK